MSQPQIPVVGQLIAGRYLLRGILGQGGMGVVFDAHHQLLDRPVAIKVLAPEVLRNPDAAARFLNEARAVTKIASDRVVQVLDVGELEGGLPFMVMERLEGQDLAQLLEARGPLPVSEAVDLVLEALEGVAHAHLEGIVHRDLKPSNLFLATRPDGTASVKVLDFGISKALLGNASGSLTATSAVLGSPLYMSPEQLRSSKNIDARTDIWSLGVIVYELLTQAMPYEGDNMVDIFAAIQEHTVRPLHELRPEVPTTLDAVVRRCLARSPKQRYRDVFALGRALAPFGSARATRSLGRMQQDAARRGVDLSPESSTLPRFEAVSRAQTSAHPDAQGRVVVAASSARDDAAGRDSHLGLRATLPSLAPPTSDAALSWRPVSDPKTPSPEAPPRARGQEPRVARVALVAGLGCALLAAIAASGRLAGKQAGPESAGSDPSFVRMSPSALSAGSAPTTTATASIAPDTPDAAVSPGAPSSPSPAPAPAPVRHALRPAARPGEAAAGKAATPFNPLTSLKPL